MEVTYKDFLDFANSQLAKESLSPFEVRNAVSRAYYALYHRALERADELSIPKVRVENAGSHAALAKRIASLGDSGKSLASQLDKAKKVRVNCDYFLEERINHKRAEFYLASVQDLISKIDRLEARK
ncbi:hypothetical protein DOQ73_23470 [Salmonella enterica subsp. enterica]|nr:hypothetical protein [Salmonella enterica subsp. enterica serovar Javiana]